MASAARVAHEAGSLGPWRVLRLRICVKIYPSRNAWEVVNPEGCEMERGKLSGGSGL